MRWIRQRPVSATYPVLGQTRCGDLACKDLPPPCPAPSLADHRYFHNTGLATDTAAPVGFRLERLCPLLSAVVSDGVEGPCCRAWAAGHRLGEIGKLPFVFYKSPGRGAPTALRALTGSADNSREGQWGRPCRSPRRSCVSEKLCVVRRSA